MYLLGVDEAGRGPLAGPVAVGVISVPEGFDIGKAFPGVADSKKLSEKNREKIYERLVMLAGRSGDPGETEPMSHGEGVRFTVEFEDALVIDREGIVPAVRRALTRGVNALAPDAGIVRVLLDGALRAPDEYAQETVIHGDSLIPLISLASIAAKVERDRLMIALAKEYPEYGFDEHKGYGTRMHLEMLLKYGPCAIHRQSFLHLDPQPE